MTSTPTACPNHGEQVLTMFDEHARCAFCGAPVDNPRQPDNEMNELLMETIVRGQNKPDASSLVFGEWMFNEYDTAEVFYRADMRSAYDAGHARASEEMGAEIETLRMQLAGCGVAAMGNTEDSKRHRIERDNPYWSASYRDVCAAVDGEIALREQLAACELRAAEYERALESLDFGRLHNVSHYDCDGDAICNDYCAACSACEVLAAHRRGGES